MSARAIAVEPSSNEAQANRGLLWQILRCFLMAHLCRFRTFAPGLTQTTARERADAPALATIVREGRLASHPELRIRRRHRQWHVKCSHISDFRALDNVLQRRFTMETSLDCLPCFVRHALEAVRFTTADVRTQEKLLRNILRRLVDLDLHQPPPAMAQWIHRQIRESIGNPDPYQFVKRRSNELALDLLPALRRTVQRSQRPLETSVRLAIAGNVIDAGTNGEMCYEHMHRAIQASLTTPLQGSIASFANAVHSAQRILYLADNAGELLFDRLLIEQLPRDKVTLAVRGAPVLNDATLEDAVAVGLTDIVEVIDNGSDAPGTLLADCSERFLQMFDSADLVISKGQGNYESLSSIHDRNIFYLLIAKCRLVASHLGCPEGSFVVRSPDQLQPAQGAHE